LGKILIKSFTYLLRFKIIIPEIIKIEPINKLIGFIFSPNKKYEPLITKT